MIGPITKRNLDLNKQLLANIIDKCKSNDQMAQKDLYLLFADKLMAVSMRYSSDMAKAKDLVQDAFIQIFTKIDTYDPDRGSFESWIIRILINIALQSIRKHKKILLTDDIQILDQKDYSINGLEQLLAADLFQLINLLPEGSKIVFNLYEIEGFKHKEIGTKLGISASTSRAHLTRAKRMLREHLDHSLLKNSRYGH